LLLRAAARGKRFGAPSRHDLEEALRRVESISPEEQDAIAAQIIETLDDEEAWARRLRGNPRVLRSMAREVLEERRRGAMRHRTSRWNEGVHLATPSWLAWALAQPAEINRPASRRLPPT
jgi:hypothetical protein